eukprot:UN30571
MKELKGHTHDNLEESMDGKDEKCCEDEILRLDQCEREFDLQQHMFLECVMEESRETMLCGDYVDWKDSVGNDCGWYEEYDMCRFDYMLIFANGDGVDAYQACCSCGGGQYGPMVRRSLGENYAQIPVDCSDLTPTEELLCLRERNKQLALSLGN